MNKIDMNANNLEALYFIMRESFPAYANEADIDHENKGFEKEDKAYSLWFESFAVATNNGMKNRDSETVEEVFLFLSDYYEKAGTSVKNCIDSCYVENLFWKLSKEITDIYWNLLPSNLQILYIKFHGSKP